MSQCNIYSLSIERRMLKQRKKRFYTESEKSLMWDRWQKGESLNSIARSLGHYHSSVQGILSKTGGIRPTQRKRSCKHLSLSEREEISRGIASGSGAYAIASQLGHSPSIISSRITKSYNCCSDELTLARTSKQVMPANTLTAT